MLADLFKNFRNRSLEICELDRAKFLSATGLAWQATLKKTKVKLNFLNDIEMLSMLEKSEEYVTLFIDMQKLITNTWRIMIKAKNCHSKFVHLQNWKVNGFYGWAMSQNLPVNNSEWIKDTSQFHQDFIKSYNE